MRVLIVHRPGAMMGGDVIAAHDYAAALRVHNAHADVVPANMLPDVSGYDWVHMWSANAPHWGLATAESIKAQGVKLAMTPNWWSRAKRLEHFGYHEQDVATGYTGAVAKTLSLADALFVCAMSEAQECWKLAPYKTTFLFNHGCTLPNGIEPQEAEDYVLCLARIEPHKNQVNLAMACRALGYELILRGAVADQAYAKQAAALGAHIGEPIGREAAIGSLSSARVHALPSFSETPGMSNMEAALLHVPALMGNIGAEAEFFGYGGVYADPTDWRHIAVGLQLCWNRPRQEWAQVPTWELVAMRALEYMEAW